MSEPDLSVTSRSLELVRPPVVLTTGEYLEQWLAGRRSLRPATYQAYRSHVRLHLIPHLGKIALTALGVAALDAMFDDLLSMASRLSIASVHRIRAVLSAALNHAVRAGLIESNPARLVDLPPIPSSRPHAWTAAELSRFLYLINEDAQMPLFALLGLRGLRRGEALGLHWSNVDLDNGQVHVREQLAVAMTGYAVGPPKSKAGIRTVALDDILTKLLAQHNVRQRSAGIVSDFVFCDLNGEALNPIWVTKYFDRIIRRTGMRRVRLHDLRHSSATIGLASGESLLEVSRRLGHSSIAITADLYSEIPAETARASAERFAAYVRSHAHD